MLNPHARAETHVGGEDTCFWLTPIVNGKEVSRGGLFMLTQFNKVKDKQKN